MGNGNQDVPLPRFWPAAGVSSPTRQWQTSNCALKRLLTRHREILGNAIAMAKAIRLEIEQLATSMAVLRRRTCRFCPEPCCMTNTVWFDFRDLLTLHLLEDLLPAQQADSEPGEACPFLSHCGCRLPWRLRPWMCLKYICPTQHALLKKAGQPDPAALYGCIDKIENQRFRMETEVLYWIRRKKRT